MASVYGHIRVANQTLARLPGRIAERIRKESAAYMIGSQGPDFCFYPYLRRVLDSARWREVAAALHGQRLAAFFRTALPYAAGRGAAMQVYLLGYLTHYATDVALHPYINSRCPDTPRHIVLEGVADRLLMQRDGITLPLYKLLPALSEWQRKEIGRLFASVLPTVYGLECEAQQVEWLLIDMRRIHRMLHDPTRLKRVLLHPVASKLKLRDMMDALFYGQGDAGEDPLNLQHTPWRYPADSPAVQTASLCDLLEAGAQRAAEMIRAAAAYFSGEVPRLQALRVLGNVSMKDGQPLR